MNNFRWKMAGAALGIAAFITVLAYVVRGVAVTDNTHQTQQAVGTSGTVSR